MVKRKCARLDGQCDLNDTQKAERDARVQKWMNNRKIDRVAKASNLLPNG